jgi:NitT/TauT family transport system ATP-binding protein
MNPPGTEIVSLRDVGKTFETGTAALDGLSLDVHEGEFVSLLGPSGCGKSTALRIIAGLSAPSVGVVEWPKGDSKIGFVFQEPTLMPWASVRENVRLPLKLGRLPAPTRRNCARPCARPSRVSDLPSFHTAIRANCPAA